MRLPWPFGRGTTSGEPASGGASTTLATGGQPAAPAVQRDATPTGAWASLPPIQRTIAAAPLVAPAAPFLHDVPGHRPLPPILQPLGHESTPSAPAGLVAAHASPVPSLTSQAPMPTRHVQRRAAEPQPAAWTGAAAGPEPDALGTSVAGAGADAGSAPEPEPVRRLATVSPSHTATPPARPLTVAPPITRSAAPAVQRSAAPPASAATAAPTAGSPAVQRDTAMPLAASGTAPARISRWSEAGSTPGSKPGLGAPLSPGPTPGTPAASSPSPSTAPSAAAGSVPSPSTELAHRPGLGAPMKALPDSATRGPAPSMPLVQRLAASHAAETGARPTTGPVPPELLPASATSPGAAPGTSAAGDRHAAAPRPEAARALPTLPVARPRAERPGAAPTPVQRSTGPVSPRTAAGPSTSPSGTAPSPTILPLAGARPIRPSVAVQRQAGADDAPEPALPVAARWPSGDGLPATVASDARPTPTPDAVPLQRLAAPDPAPVQPPAVGTGWHGAHSPALGSPGLAQAASLGAPGGVPAPSIARRAPAPATSIAPTLQLARATAAAGAAPAPLVIAQPVAAPAGRIEAPVSTAPAPTVQTSPSPAAALPTFTSTPVVQREAGTAPPAAGGQTGRTDRELDELAKQLFGRVRGQLRAEIINEREARGLGFDAF